jgi:hypothetical protein
MKTYDPDKVFLSWMGINITGFAGETFINAARAEDGYSMQVGSQGEVCRIRNLNRTGTVEVTLMHSSPINDFLDALATVDEETGIGGVGPLTGRDDNGNMKIRSTYTWVQKKPDVKRGKDAETVVWIFSCAKLELAPRGNII